MAAQSASMPRSTELIIDSPYEIRGWRAPFQWVLYIPHGIVVAALGNLSIVAAVLHWLVVLFTGRPNRDLYNINAMILRYETRTSLFLIGFSEQFPPFAFSSGGPDDGAYSPVRLELAIPPESLSRKALFNGVLAIPHYILIGIYGIAAFFVLWIARLAVIFTGKWPAGMRYFITRFGAYYARVWTYAMMADNKYPSFSLS